MPVDKSLTSTPIRLSEQGQVSIKVYSEDGFSRKFPPIGIVHIRFELIKSRNIEVHESF